MNGSLIEVPDVSALRCRSGRKWSRYPADVLPAWIADMDLLPAPAIRATLRAAAEEGDLGYGPSGRDSGVPQSFAAWALRRWGWIVEPEAVLVMPDVVGGIANCIEALTRPGDAILVQTPIYPPFLSCVTRGGRRLVTSETGVGTIDFGAIEAAVVQHRVRMLLLCHPHNPTGRCFDRGELLQLAALARKYELIVVSDEVHGDLVYPPREHVPFAALDAAVSTVTLNSASKAFNVAGLRCAVCVVQDNSLREQLAALPAQRWTAFSTLGIRATLAAWSDSGEEWLLACVQHLQALRDRLAERLSRNCAAIRCAPAQASYLAWLDCRALHLDREPAVFFLERARVALSPGHEFGAPGRGHARLNFATSAAILDEILERMCAASTA
ncbi:MAG TPA: PatB family C-S lyase [Steroidobacteraceae bacterium]|nr:PatB family C-S lyase [Steroidobacteraceae bacterium]